MSLTGLFAVPLTREPMVWKRAPPRSLLRHNMLPSLFARAFASLRCCSVGWSALRRAVACFSKVARAPTFVRSWSRASEVHGGRHRLARGEWGARDGENYLAWAGLLCGSHPQILGPSRSLYVTLPPQCPSSTTGPARTTSATWTAGTGSTSTRARRSCVRWPRGRVCGRSRATAAGRLCWRRSWSSPPRGSTARPGPSGMGRFGCGAA
jgi:hypothetical protein